MKILSVSHLFPNEQEPRYGIFVARQLAALAKEGADITVLVPRAQSPIGTRAFLRDTVHDHLKPLRDVPGVNAVSIPFMVLPGAWFKRWAGLSGYQAVKKTASELHRQKSFDVIYATDLLIGGDIARRLSRKLNLPAACLAIGNDVNVDPRQSRGMDRHFQRIVRELDATLACGDRLARTMDAISGRQSPSVYGVVDLDVFSPVSNQTAIRQTLDLPQHKVIALFAGYLYRQKGVLELIQAFELIRQEDPLVHLVLCGHRGDADVVLQKAAMSAASSAITFVGDVAPSDMHKYMQSADLLVLPSYTEGMPNVVMEAMACGIPVIATSVGGLPDALADCEGAILIPPKDHQALAEAMKAVIRDPARRTRMGIAARQKAEASFGIAENAHRVLAELRALKKRDT